MTATKESFVPTFADEESPTNGDSHVDFIDDGPTMPMVLTDDFVTQFETGIQQYKRWLGACFSLTTESHWMNFGSETEPAYYLQSAGAERLMAPLGISYERPTYRKEVGEDKDGRYYVYFVEAMFESKTLRRRGYYVGRCTSRDQFFNSQKGWTPELGEGEIMLSAFSNLEVNAVTRLAGLRNPDPEMLKKAGLDLSKIARVEFKSGSDKPISQPQANRLFAIAKIAKVSEEAIRAKLREHGYEIADGQKPYDLVKRKDYEAVCTWVEEQGKKPEPTEKTEKPPAAEKTITADVAKSLWEDAKKRGITEAVFKAELKKLGYPDTIKLIQIKVGDATKIRAWISTMNEPKRQREPGED